MTDRKMTQNRQIYETLSPANDNKIPTRFEALFC